MTAMNPHSLGQYSSLHIARVIDNVDPDSRGRIQVELQANELQLWASVVSLSAGQAYGVCCIPRVDEQVVVAFVSPDLPLVLGSFWSGSSSVPTEADPHEQRYAIRTPAGTVIEMDDEDGPRIEIRTPAGHYIKMTDSGGGEYEASLGGQSVKMTSSEVSITSGGPVKVEGSTVEINASTVTVNAAMSKFSGVVQADTVIATSVVGSSYTPGAGNIW